MALLSVEGEQLVWHGGGDTGSGKADVAPRRNSGVILMANSDRVNTNDWRNRSGAVALDKGGGSIVGVVPGACRRDAQSSVAQAANRRHALSSG